MDTSTYQFIYTDLCDFSLVVIRYLKIQLSIKIQQETNNSTVFCLLLVKHYINNIFIKTVHLHKVQKLLDAIHFLFRDTKIHQKQSKNILEEIN